MMKRFYIILAAAWLLAIPATAQQHPHCGTDEMVSHLLQTDPNAAARLENTWHLIDEYIAGNAGRSGEVYPVLTVPVVFHVIHSGQPVGTGANIADTQMISQIAVLNECYRKRNADTALVPQWFKDRVADLQIEFVLAVTDPNGNPTSGITRHQYNTINDFNLQVKPATQWDPYRYLNFWTTFLGSTLLGYATPPGLFPIDQDGVVVDYRYVGRAPANPFVTDYPLGKTAVHEVGHWLGLFHTFQDSCTGNTAATCTIGGDRICDTPASKEASFGSPSLNQNTCTDSPVDDPDMWMNYMDYADDDNTHMFTYGQRDVMRAVLNTSRVGILSSLGGTNLNNTFSYTGKVVDAATNAGIPLATVYLDGAQDYEVVTDANGFFYVNNMYTGYYDIYAGKWGYMTTAYSYHTYMSNAFAQIDIPIEGHHYYDDFMMNFNWTTSNTASGGFWVRNIPLGTNNQGEPANPMMDANSDFGIKAWVTGNAVGAVGFDDVDNGTVQLVSPQFDVQTFSDPYIRYNRWFYNGPQSGSTPDDVMTFKLNNGSATVTLETVNGTTGNTNRWIEKEWRIADYIAPSASMRLIVEVSDANGSNANITEGGLDRFEVLEQAQLGVNTPAYNIGARLYPNPGKNQITIDYTLPETAEATLYIYNILGEAVIASNMGEVGRGMYNLDVNHLPGGTYFAKIKTIGGEKNIKFLLIK